MSARRQMLQALRRGTTFTVPQARAWFGIERVDARIEELRDFGYPIYTKTKANGQKYYAYASNGIKTKVNRDVLVGRSS